MEKSESSKDEPTPKEAPSTKEEPKEANWEFHSETESQTQASVTAPLPKQQTVSWSASEYIAHDKSAGWYFTAGLAVIAIACVVFFATDQSWFSSVLVLIAGATFIFYAIQSSPRVLEYTLDAQGLTIADKIYEYHRFKSYSIMHEGPISSISLQPMERFMPTISLYYDPKDENKIALILGTYLPYEERELPQVDKLMRKIRF